MDIGKVIGTVVATRKDSSLNGTRLFIVQRLDEKGESVGNPLVATDTALPSGPRRDCLYGHRWRRGWRVAGAQNAC